MNCPFKTEVGEGKPTPPHSKPKMPLQTTVFFSCSNPRFSSQPILGRLRFSISRRYTRDSE